MTIVAEKYDYVIGIGRHARTHTYAIVNTRTGTRGDCQTFPSSPTGMNRALAWITKRTVVRPLEVGHYSVSPAGHFGTKSGHFSTTSRIRLTSHFLESRVAGPLAPSGPGRPRTRRRTQEHVRADKLSEAMPIRFPRCLVHMNSLVRAPGT